MKKRVKIPKQSASALLELAKKMREKHLADGDASPLKVLNWDKVSPVIDEAIELEEKALRWKREKLSIFQQRAHRLQTVLSIVRSGRDVLVGVHIDEMKALGLWGFDVLDNRANVQKEEGTSSATS